MPLTCKFEKTGRLTDKTNIPLRSGRVICCKNRKRAEITECRHCEKGVQLENNARQNEGSYPFLIDSKVHADERAGEGSTQIEREASKSNAKHAKYNGRNGGGWDHVDEVEGVFLD